jgi:hypothetical protein
MKEGSSHESQEIKKTAKKGVGHPIWKDHISFCFISIPVTLYSSALVKGKGGTSHPHEA